MLMFQLIPTIRQAYRMNLTPIFIWMVRLLTIIGTIAMCIILYGYYLEPSPIRYQNLPFPIESSVEQGRSIPILIERCNDSKEEMIYISTRQLRNTASNTIIVLPNTTVSLRPGCHRNVIRSSVVPRETPPGFYVVEGDAIVRGMIRQHKIPIYSETFEIIPMKALSKALSKALENENQEEAAGLR